MKKTFRIEDLECANCAAKMEDAINKLQNITAANINFMQQKLTLEAPDDMFEQALLAAEKAMRKIEPDVRVLV